MSEPTSPSFCSSAASEASTVPSAVEPPQVVGTAKELQNGAVCKEMSSGISLRQFILICLNALVTIGLSVPFMFTTTGLLAIPIQAMTGISIFLCIRIVSKALSHEKVKEYAEERGIPLFEREYTFLAEFCGGKLGRRIASMTIFLEYFISIIGLMAAMGITTNIIIDAITVEWWIIIFSFLSLLIIVCPFMREVNGVLAIAAVVTTFTGLLLWITAGVMVESSHLKKTEPNLLLEDPPVQHLFTALSLSIWNSGAAPSLPPFYGCVKNTSSSRITMWMLICLVISILYVFVLGAGGILICDGPCEQVYIENLPLAPDGVLPKWLIYTGCALLLLRMLSYVPVLVVPVLVSSETQISHLLNKFSRTAAFAGSPAWRIIWRCAMISLIAVLAVVARSQLAYLQAVGGILLTACSIYIFPLWFYLYIQQPSGFRLYATYTALAVVISFVTVGTFYAIHGLVQGLSVVH